MAWRMFRCRDTGRVWLWKTSKPDGWSSTSDEQRHLMPDENTRLALYGQYPVETIAYERDLAPIQIGTPVGKWPYPANKNPLEADLQGRGY